ncbi:Acetyltransferase (GNAT) domain-containing protein [Filimonas lacunae]|uniref:Acetyltransferase (GNAT) domain-containing protein n=1 Tax=Filimonas lacunae TaxID=477680 RepID=A0A173MKI8_9BACT|nr:GNAT family N-acetyltransferase [Filimonas lacunae]BAV08153.1 GCN5-related N-acetyltransferase [Filimonas lacunae]SIT10044.1 Acetyltransferase (GNAT) domain-containing protein [Filimonas lacunae]
MEIKEVPLDIIWQMRKEVMYPSFTIDEVKLADDATGLHMGVYEADTPVSVVSVFIKNQQLQFRKFATLTTLQGKGYGKALLSHVMQLAQQQQCTAVWCNARVSAAPFYQRFGMQPVGEQWQQHGHEFVKMEKQL